MVMAVSESGITELDQLPDLIERLSSLPADQPTAIHSLESNIIKILGSEAKKGNFTKESSESAEAKVKREWLVEQLSQFSENVLNFVSSKNKLASSVSFRTLMNVVLIDWKYCANFSSETLAKLFVASFEAPVSDVFYEWTSFLEYSDVRYYFLLQVCAHLNFKKYKVQPAQMEKLILVLLSLKPLDEESVNHIYCSKIRFAEAKRRVLRVGSQRKAFQQAWQAVITSNINISQLKSVMSEFHTALLPNFEQPKLFMDFLTDAYNHGGSIALLALNSLFYLIQYHGLDYPKFYEKLYALLEDGDLLYSRHRARFLRLLDLFLSSSHLPATIVASVVKRLARLSLFAPPGALAAVLPLIYNQLKRTKACMVMIHRTAEISGPDCDPFEEDNTDPLTTNAIDSSLWELNALAQHYQPNIAAIAKIFSLPFRKPHYELDHFFSHSYETMFATEMNRKWNPDMAIEFETVEILGGDLDDNHTMIQSSWTL